MSTPEIPAGYERPVTSPNVPVDAGIVVTRKQFSDGLTLDLTDSEISQSLQLKLPIKQKWTRSLKMKFSSPGTFTVEQAMKLIDQFEDELVSTLAEKMDLIATVDATPV